MDARYGRSEEGARVHGVHHRFRCVENARVFGFLTTFSLLLCCEIFLRTRRRATTRRLVQCFGHY